MFPVCKLESWQYFNGIATFTRKGGHCRIKKPNHVDFIGKLPSLATQCTTIPLKHCRRVQLLSSAVDIAYDFVRGSVI